MLSAVLLLSLLYNPPCPYRGRVLYSPLPVVILFLRDVNKFIPTLGWDGSPDVPRLGRLFILVGFLGWARFGVILGGFRKIRDLDAI